MDRRLFYKIYRESEDDDWLDDSGDGVKDTPYHSYADFDDDFFDDGQDPDEYDDDLMGGKNTVLSRVDLLSDEELEDLGWHKTGERAKRSRNDRSAPWGSDLFTKGDPSNPRDCSPQSTRTRAQISNSKEATNGFEDAPWSLSADNEFFNSTLGDDAAYAGNDFLDDGDLPTQAFDSSRVDHQNYVTPDTLDTNFEKDDSWDDYGVR